MTSRRITLWVAISRAGGLWVSSREPMNNNMEWWESGSYGSFLDTEWAEQIAPDLAPGEKRKVVLEVADD